MGVGRCLGLLPIIADLRLQPGERFQWIGRTHAIASPKPNTSKPNTSGGRSTDAFIPCKVLDSSFVAVQSVNINIVVLCQTINLNINIIWSLWIQSCNQIKWKRVYQLLSNRLNLHVPYLGLGNKKDINQT